MKQSLKNIENIYAWIFSIFLFVFIVAPKISTLILIIAVLYFVIHLFQKKIEFQLNKPSIYLVVLFCLYLIWILFSRHYEIAFKTLETKLSLLIFPLLFSFKLNDISSFLRKISIGLILGLISTSFFGIVNGFLLYHQTSSFVSFLSSGISPIHHPTYLVVFHVVSCFLAVYGYKSAWKLFTRNRVLFYVIFSLIIQFLCLSLAGLLFSFMMIFIISMVFLKKRLSTKYFIASSVILPLSLVVIFLKVPYFEGEFHGATKYIETYMSNPNGFVLSRKKDISGSEARLIMWTVSVQEIIKNPMGVGSGNVDEVLFNNLNDKGLVEFAKKSYNPHNQFFQTTLEIGVLGLLTLIIGLSFSVYYAIKSSFWPFLFLVINLIFNSFFESMLQRQSGVVFYSFFICLFSLICIQKIKDENISNCSL